MSSAAHSHVNAPSIQEILHQKDQRITVLEGELFVMKEKLAWLKKQIFGTKSERRVADLSTQPLLPELDLSCQDNNRGPEYRSHVHRGRCTPECLHRWWPGKQVPSLAVLER